MTPLLDVQGLTMRFGGVTALSGVDFSVRAGSITALIGPNGAGKTTVFNCLTGFYKATEGRLLLWNERREENGEASGERSAARSGGRKGSQRGGRRGPIDLGLLLGGKLLRPAHAAGLHPLAPLYYSLFGGSHRVARAGVARTFQNVRLFREMTAMENLLVAQHTRANRNLLAGVFLTPGFRRAEAQAIARARELLDIAGLAGDGDRLAGELPYGRQRVLEIVRALATQPRLICLDEPAAGLNPRETEALSALIRRLRDEFGLTVLLIEHDMGLVMEISDHVVVLDHGESIAQGTPQAVQNDPKVQAAYLGVEEESAA